MDALLNSDQWSVWGDKLLTWLEVWVLSASSGIQVGLLVLFYFVARALAGRFDKTVNHVGQNHAFVERFDHYVEPLYLPTIFLIIIWISMGAGLSLGYPVYLLDIAAKLLLAWVFIHLVANIVGKRSTARLVATIGWSVAALSILNLLGPLVEILDGAAVNLGNTRVSLFDVIWGIASFFIFIWLALVAARMIDIRLQRMDGITPSAQVLIAKVIKIVFVSVAFLVALNSTGIDLTALAVFGGALGVGLGFGLQKVVSNFISGMILLLDKSIKPGDVVQVADTYGAINSLSARFTSVITRDGTEYLIPNEDMITTPVINWSHSDRKVRRRIPVQISYDSDVEKAMAIMVGAAKDNPRVLIDPPVQARFIGFGENGLDLELRMWIQDPQNGVRNVASEVLLKMWHDFKDQGIQLPYPQRVIHFADKDDHAKVLGQASPDKAVKDQPSSD